MKNRIKNIVIFCSLNLVTSISLQADDIFPAGAESKAAGMESSLSARSAPSLLYNPANVDSGLRGRAATYTEVGFVKVEQSYEHRDFDPVKVMVATPIASVGVVGKPLDDKLTLGLYVFPAKKGGVTVRGMPRDLAGSYVPLAVEKNDQVYKTAWGGSYRINQFVSVGGSILHSFETTEINASVLTTAAPVVTQKGKNNFYRGAIGTRFEAQDSVLSVAYRSDLKKTYKGEQLVAGSKSTIAKKDYEPAVWSLGLGYEPGRWSVGADINAKQWKNGKTHISEGVLEVDEADLSNVIEYGARGAYKFGSLSLGVSFAFLPSPWGSGSAQNENGKAEPGVGFGMAEGVDRRAYGISSGYQLAKGSVSAGVTRIAGARVVQDGGFSPGYYQVETLVLSGGVDYLF